MFLAVRCGQAKRQPPLVNRKRLVACFGGLVRHSAGIRALLGKGNQPFLQFGTVGADGDSALGFVKEDLINPQWIEHSESQRLLGAGFHYALLGLFQATRFTRGLDLAILIFCGIRNILHDVLKPTVQSVTNSPQHRHCNRLVLP